LPNARLRASLGKDLFPRLWCVGGTGGEWIAMLGEEVGFYERGEWKRNRTPQTLVRGRVQAVCWAEGEEAAAWGAASLTMMLLDWTGQAESCW